MRQRVLLIVLGVVILLAIYTFIIRKPSSSVSKTVIAAKSKVEQKTSQIKEQVESTKPIKEMTKAVKEPVKSIVSAITTKRDSSYEEPATEKGMWGTDPFVRDWMLTQEIKDLKLKAITHSGTKAYALINDQILETGEIIAGKQIIAIEKDKIILEQGGNTFTLLLGQ